MKFIRSIEAVTTGFFGVAEGGHGGDLIHVLHYRAPKTLPRMFASAGIIIRTEVVGGLGDWPPGRLALDHD